MIWARPFSAALVDCLTASPYPSQEDRCQKADPEVSGKLIDQGNKVTTSRFDLYRKLAEVQAGSGSGE